jgi:hypothetical protein
MKAELAKWWLRKKGLAQAEAPAYPNLYSVLFDGVDERIACGAVDTMDDATECTWSVWFKQAASPPSNAVLFNQARGGGGNTFQFLFGTSGALARLGVYDGTSFTELRYSRTADTAWHHVCVVFDGAGADNAARLKAYFDGAPVVASSFVGTVPAALNSAAQRGTAALFIGGGGTGTTNNWGGHVDEPAIFVGTAATPAQVLEIYGGAAGAGAPVDLSALATMPPPEHWWRMGDAMTYPTIHDQGAATAADGTAAGILSEADLLQTEVP